MKLIFQAYKKTDQILLCQLSITEKKKKKIEKAHKRCPKLFEEKIKQEKQSKVASSINVNVSINILQTFF